MSRFNIALLGEQEVPGAEIAPEAADAVLDEIVESPEGDMAAAEEIASEMDEAAGAIDEAADTAETLENVGDVLETAEGEGGIDPIAAEAIKICVEHMRTRMGMQSAKPLIALEGFKSKTTRVQALRVAKEDIKETAKKIWQAIVNAFNKAIAWVKDFFNKLFDGATKLKARAEKVKAIAEGKKGAKLGDKTVDNSGVAEALRVDGKVGTIAQVEGGVKELAAWVTSKEQATQQADEIAAKAEKVLETVEKKEDFEKAVLHIGESFTKSTTYKLEGLGEGLEAYATFKCPLGDKVQISVAVKEKTVEAVKKHIGSCRVNIVDVEGKKPLLKTEMETMTPEKVVALATEVGKVAEQLLKAKPAVEKIQARQKKLQDYAKRLASSTKDDARENVRLAAQVARVAMSVTSTGIAKANQYVITTANAALQYGTLSLAQAGKEETKAE